MIKVAIVSANMGNFDPVIKNVEQKLRGDVSLTEIRVNDSNFHLRVNAMTPRLQARIPKVFGWQMFPGYDFYIWVDASCALLNPDSVMWFLEKCNKYEIAVFKHPDRNTIAEEAAFIKEKLQHRNLYLCPRYMYELLDEELAEIKADKSYIDNKLYASTAFIYRPTDGIKAAFKEWWYHISRYHIVDQTGFPYALDKFNCVTNVINEDYLHCLYITYTRNGKYENTIIHSR